MFFVYVCRCSVQCISNFFFSFTFFVSDFGFTSRTQIQIWILVRIKKLQKISFALYFEPLESIKSVFKTRIIHNALILRQKKTSKKCTTVQLHNRMNHNSQCNSRRNINTQTKNVVQAELGHMFRCTHRIYCQCWVCVCVCVFGIGAKSGVKPKKERKKSKIRNRWQSTVDLHYLDLRQFALFFPEIRSFTLDIWPKPKCLWFHGWIHYHTKYLFSKNLQFRNSYRFWILWTKPNRFKIDFSSALPNAWWTFWNRWTTLVYFFFFFFCCFGFCL